MKIIAAISRYKHKFTKRNHNINHNNRKDDSDNYYEKVFKIKRNSLRPVFFIEILFFYQIIALQKL